MLSLDIKIHLNCNHICATVLCNWLGARLQQFRHRYVSQNVLCLTPKEMYKGESKANQLTIELI